MKVLILCALVAAAHAGLIHAPIIGTGSSTVSRSEDGLGNYAFGYNEGHATGGTFRRETGDALGRKVGSYGLVAADGRRRVVSYVADGLGFRANVQTNEPGTEPRDPAAVVINKAGLRGPIGGAIAVASPLAVAAAPVAAVAHSPLLHRGLGLGLAGIATPYAAGIAAPVAGIAAPIAAGIVAPGLASSYSTSISHGIGAPLLAKAW